MEINAIGQLPAEGLLAGFLMSLVITSGIIELLITLICFSVSPHLHDHQWSHHWNSHRFFPPSFLILQFFLKGRASNNSIRKWKASDCYSWRSVCLIMSSWCWPESQFLPNSYHWMLSKLIAFLVSTQRSFSEHSGAVEKHVRGGVGIMVFLSLGTKS